MAAMIITEDRNRLICDEFDLSIGVIFLKYSGLIKPMPSHLSPFFNFDITSQRLDWVLVKVSSSQSHRVAQCVPGWRIGDPIMRGGSGYI